MADEWTVVNRKKEKSKQQQRNSRRQRQGIGQSKIQNNDLKDNNKGFNEDNHVSSSSKKVSRGNNNWRRPKPLLNL